ncbi:MAG: hypothetical protein E6F98_10910 [Actinobacteria bacterium]|nr:MAG: hypothetical protein E6F98_10910 [Actinomycetota bacterium]
MEERPRTGHLSIVGLNVASSGASSVGVHRRNPADANDEPSSHTRTRGRLAHFRRRAGEPRAGGRSPRVTRSAKPGRLDWGDLVRLAERGHEIGGHTESHAALTEIPLEQARQEIARDRDALTSRGLDPSSFAYPYGKFTDEIADLVRALGYAAARGVGGVVETVPPLNPYQLRTPHSARTWTTADHLAGLTLAAQHEEGWLILPFHHIGHDRGSTYTTQPGQFTAYLDWLVERDMPVIPVREVIARAN